VSDAGSDRRARNHVSTSTPPRPVARRRPLLRLLQVAFVVTGLAYAGWAVAGQWTTARSELASLDLRPIPVLGATALVFATYALLIQLWRYVLARWGSRLAFTDAVRIWSIANLGRFVPVRVAQIGAMAYLARERGVSATAATGSALLNTAINIATGIVVALVAGGRLLDALRPGARDVALALALVATAGVAALPWLLPRALTLAARLLRRDLTAAPRMPLSAVWITALGNVLAWLLYGVAFQLFTAGVIGEAAGALPAYIAVYTGSYIIGYLVLFAPGGLLVREAALVTGMVTLGLATTTQATVVAVTSRLWLTVLEIVPGLLFLALGALRRRPTLTDGDAPS
jgi:hypothetical protein